MADPPSPETQSCLEAHQDVFFHQFAWIDSLIQSQRVANYSQSLILGVSDASRRSSAVSILIRAAQEAIREVLQSFENHEEVVGSQAEGEEVQTPETVVNYQAEDAQARPPESEDLSPPPTSILEDDTIVQRTCFDNYRLEDIESRLLPVSVDESDNFSVCREKYNTTLDAHTEVMDIRYCSGCKRSLAMKPDTSNSHQACAMQKCLHVSGRYCIIQWLKEKSTCPLCRDEVPLY
ncbi:hypothetical protein EAE96_007155 [Botrytis aclada]|nr:hypothetical protein EAE96_007155 [Botrytis aclada]